MLRTIIIPIRIVNVVTKVIILLITIFMVPLISVSIYIAIIPSVVGLVFIILTVITVTSTKVIVALFLFPSNILRCDIVSSNTDRFYIFVVYHFIFCYGSGHNVFFRLPTIVTFETNTKNICFSLL